MHELLSINPVSFESWLLSFIIAGTIIVVMEIFKRVKSAVKNNTLTEKSSK